MDRKVSAIVLAAGSSKRMGGMKQLAQIGGKSLLETTLSAVNNSAVSETILVLGFRAEEIQKSIPILDTTILVMNDSFETGMSSSIRAGIAAVSQDSSAAMIVLADQPFLKPPLLNSLIEAYQNSQAKILLPVYKGFRGNPVLIDRSLFPEMMQISGDVGCRSIFGIHEDQIEKVDVDDIGILIDVDHPEDLAKFSGMQPTKVELQELDLENRAVPETTRQLLIVGSDEIALTLARLGKLMKFRVTLIDPLLTKAEFAETDVIMNELNLKKATVNHHTFIVVASRGKFDEEALQQAAETPAAYVALVGSKKRGAEIIQRLKLPEKIKQRIYCPAGLNLHAETPEEIALSVMAQIIEADRSRSKT